MTRALFAGMLLMFQKFRAPRVMRSSSAPTSSKSPLPSFLMRGNSIENHRVHYASLLLGDSPGHFTFLHFCISTFLHAHTSTFRHFYVSIFLHSYISTLPHLYISTFHIPTFLRFDISTFLYFRSSTFLHCSIFLRFYISTF